jgi:hypothetical protein
VSSSIWTQCGAKRNAATLDLRACRIVEGQHRVATLKLVDGHEEQEVLEELIDRVKPPLPAGREFAGLHYLLATPFRHPPLRHGSRFGSRFERGIWYGARTVATVLAEAAYYRFVFLEGSAADLGYVSTEHSVFWVQVRTSAGVDLQGAAFSGHQPALTSKSDYSRTQSLGAEMRADGIDAFLYASARDPGGGANVGVLSPAAFGAKRPSPRVLPVWHCLAHRSRVIFRRRDLAHDETYDFPRATFEVKGRLPSAAT